MRLVSVLAAPTTMTPAELQGFIDGALGAQMRTYHLTGAAVAIVVDGGDYIALAGEMQANAGALTRKTRFALAKKAFTHTAAYDAAIGNYLTCRETAEQLTALQQECETQVAGVSQSLEASSIVLKPVAVTPQFWIVPSWHAVPAAARQVIRLDPGLAFGTGTHPTTRMCLRWIAAHAPLGPRVLDYGCGSGILAIGAALHGAQSVDAVDIDPAAVQATQANAAANGVQLRAGLPDAAHGLYDTVLANILATPLKVLAPLLCAHVAAGGALVLAGVLERQTEELRAAYAPWLALQASDHEDGWVLLTAERPR